MKPDLVAIAFFAGFITLTLGITYWAARKTKTTETCLGVFKWMIS